MLKKPKVSILLVYYNEEKEILVCLESIKNLKTNLSYEVVVVDNSEDGIIKEKISKFPFVKYVKAPGNIGYGRGINLAVKNAQGEYIFTLNPDTKIIKGTIEKLIKFVESKKTKTAVSPMLVSKKGRRVALLGTNELTPLRAVVGLSFFNKLFPKNKISQSYWVNTKNKKKPYKADVISGIFLIKRADFIKAGGFDENLFLYFEDTDIFKRLKEKGYSLYILPDAEIVHLGQVATSKNLNINKIFRKSRFYYFKKHFGLFSALFVEAFLRLNKWNIVLAFILIIGAFLRFYRLPQNLNFHGELGFDYLAVKNIVEGKQTLLLGPPLSHPWLKLAPLFYWIMAVLLPIFDWHPLVGAYFFAALGVIGIWVFYMVLKRLSNEKIALISAYLMAISPYWLHITRSSRFNFPVTILFLPYLYFLVKVLKEKGKGIFWLGFTLGLMYNFFPAIITLLPAAFIAIFIKRREIRLQSLGKGLLGLVIPILPFLLYNVLNKFEIIFDLAVWLPYRIAGFLGLYPKNTATPEILRDNFTSLYEFFWQSFLPKENLLVLLLVLGLIVYFVYQVKVKVFGKLNNYWLSLTIIFFLTYLALFLHGAPPIHYYYSILPIPIVLFSHLVYDLSKFKLGLYLSAVILVLITYFSLNFYFSEKWFYRQQEVVVDGKMPVPFNLQERVARTIYDDAGGRDFTLKRVGEDDHFDYDFAQNYKYLLWRFGNEPVEKANLTYTIYEDLERLDENGDSIWVANIAIVKNEN